MTFTNAEKRAAVEREIKMRKRVYSRLVSEGKKSQAEADRAIAIFEAIRDDYPAEQKEMF